MKVEKLRVDFPDDDLKRRVRYFLNQQDRRAYGQLRVDVLHGRVTLSGEVPTFYKKQIAMTICQHVAGVLQLNDEIQVPCPDDRLPNKPR